MSTKDVEKLAGPEKKRSRQRNKLLMYVSRKARRYQMRKPLGIQAGLRKDEKRLDDEMYVDQESVWKFVVG